MLIRLNYPPDLVKEPVISQLIARFRLNVNILRAQVSREEGWLAIELTGDTARLKKALSWLREQGLEIIENPDLDTESPSPSSTHT